MSVESIIYTQLAASDALEMYVGEGGSPFTSWRIYPDTAPQTAIFPLVTYTVMAVDHVASLDGSSGLARAMVEVECFALTLATALAMADAVSAALFGNFATFKGIQQDRSWRFDEEQRIFVASQDFAIWS